MNHSRYKTTNWKQYNQALINRNSLIFWVGEEAIQLCIKLSGVLWEPSFI
ncbi:Mobile element protein (plasmid) [Candidatus Enterovibrio altilux]|uniref:Mobile element protein n=1 Tax=Candidatus Enterovibrio altilux TaxID=1927128 RepID=A0A291BAU9_9GAMM|nr:Mobile element protein [Candidatus Enterovibrio luxaltus]